ncbi:MAG: hypothetical protein NVS4B11_38410 [Ktedonobacteraceae bacterium]
MIVRIGLAAFAILGSLVLGWSLLHHQTNAHAATGVVRASTLTNPWGLALDTAGHIWVAEPACDASPVCASPPPGVIGEYSTANDTKVADFKASGAYNPVFLAVDVSGNIWFTDPTHNAIGELVPGTNTWTEYPVPTANTVPYDLIMSGGNIWFTESLTSKIGFFNITTHAFVENAIPTANANPYGITLAAHGVIWFTENNTTNAGLIGSFTATASGTLPAGAIKEHAITNKAPHLITSDKKGNIWFSEGFGGKVGEYTTAAKDIEYPVSTGICPPAPAPCSGTHISGIAVDSNNLVWFDDSLSNRVGYVNPTSGTSTAISVANPPTDTSPHTHDGLLVDANNNVWVSEQNGFNLDELPPGTVNGPPSSAPAGPVAKTWYFAEGRVGKGFREYLTIDNPGAVACGVDITYYYTADGSATQQTKTVSNVPIAPVSRFTESVNNDIGLADSAATGDSAATIVTMNKASTCAGVMVERPVYFTNYHGISSGTTVAGATTLGVHFSFADVASDATHISYLTILNPPGGAIATVTATYYAGGKAVGTQKATVPAGGRGTLAPSAIIPALPSHSLAVVTSTAPVMVERPTYFLNESHGASGAYDIVGAAAAATDWFFAEGYTGSTTQENLTIANPGAISATANVTLKSQTGGVNKTFAVTVAGQSQVVWNVNQNNTFGGTPEVSAEVKSTTALVVQREMYFQYQHSLTGMPTVQANGGTDVLGLVGPITKSSYSFAEGYTHPGYNEWLTLQNPNTTAETVTVTLTNGSGQVATVQVNVPANGRQTEDITADSVRYFNPGTSLTGNAISMTVQTLNNGGTFVAERPEYYNTSGQSPFVVQGGTDIIGFGG